MTARALPVLGSVGVGLCLIGFAVALIETSASAGDRFRHAAASSAELAALQAIAGAAARSADPRAIGQAALSYRTAVLTETRLLGADPGQKVELRAADDLVRTAATGDRTVLAQRIAAVAERERSEARQISADMDRLRRRALALAALLGLAAVGSAILAVAGALGAQRQLIHEVAERTADLVAIDRSRRLFFAKISHELRTPVTVLRGEAEVALAAPRQEIGPLREALGHVVASAEDMERRIADLLGLAQAESGQLHLAHTCFDLAQLVRDTVASLERAARALGVGLETRGDAAIRIKGDARWLGQALAAVLDNAIRFSPVDGTIEVLLSLDADVALVSVADRGRGIAANALPHVFDAYFREDHHGAGSGLGLALARWVVEEHGGSIVADAREGGGCVITMRLQAR